jgi:hypothetical protein
VPLHLLTLLIVPAAFSLADGLEKRLGPALRRFTYDPSHRDGTGDGQGFLKDITGEQPSSHQSPSRCRIPDCRHRPPMAAGADAAVAAGCWW